MFTGIIQAQGIVKGIERFPAGVRLTLVRSRAWKRLVLGESIAVDGVCLTLCDVSKNTLSFDVMDQTSILTSLATLKKGSTVNLERALRASDLIGGHFVSGHVDAMGRIARIVDQPNDHRLTVQIPKALIKFCPARGSIALNGVSLTIAESSKTTITVALVDYTRERTNLGLLKKGDAVNIEVDLIARYLEKLSQR
ncbi:riboflavin synthase [Candidatus Uhrbacteria bacterium]|nr:riboflavin synthase [Candidatus Uhrbacteria bacterium]